MYKNLSIALLIVAFGLVAIRSTGTPTTTPTTPTSPIIITKRRLVNQTAPIPTTTIFTPAHDGMYRLSMYSTVTQANSTVNDNWYTYVYWSDDAGAEQTNEIPLSWNSGNAPPYAWANSPGDQPGLVLTLEVAAGTPISYAVSGVSDGSAFSLYYVLEKIE